MRYFVIEMPVNAAGQGPELDPPAVADVVWEVWDDNNVTVSVHNSAAEAQAAADRLNVLAGD